MPVTGTPVSLAEYEAQYQQRRAMREARQEKFAAMFGHLGDDMVYAVKIHGRDDLEESTTWAEGLAWLRRGITVTLACVGSTNRRTTHAMRFDADGTVSMSHHTEIPNPAAEALLYGLGATEVTCIALAATLTRAPEPIYREPGTRQTAKGRLRILYAAVAWAQREDAPWDLIGPLLTAGVTPQTLDVWLADGWTLEQALPFLTAEANRQVANRWRDAGIFTKRAAKLAAAGTSPNDDQRWTDAGFTPGRAQRWRTARLNLSPADCKALEDRGWTPTDWRSIQHYAPHHLAQTPSGPRAIDEATAMQWIAAGVGYGNNGRKGGSLLSWWANSNANLDQALMWSNTGVSGFVISQLMADPAIAPLVTPERVTAWVQAGAPTAWTVDMKIALASGLDPEAFQTVVRVHPRLDDRSWSFRDRLTAVQGFLAS